MNKKAPTLEDIAKELGLSKSTISRALKDHPDISKETKEAVNKVVKKIKYIPNTVAGSLRFKKSKVIGLIVPQISPFFLPSIVKGIEEIIHQNGYNLLILQSNESYQREVENLEILISNNVEGILISVSRQTTDYSHFQSIINMELPIVFYDRVINELNIDIVTLDDITASFNAVKHLINQRRKKIAICTGNLNLLISQNRLKGYKMALENHQIPIKEEYIISCEWTEEAKVETLKLLELNNPPDAIFAISDLTLSGVMAAIYSKNLRIPQDISVIGFCEDPFRTMYKPSITAISPMGEKIGRTSAEVLFQRIRTSPFAKLEPRVILIEGQLIIGQST